MGASTYSPWYRRQLRRFAPWLFRKCLALNYHWRWDQVCFCELNCNGHGMMYRVGSEWKDAPIPAAATCGLENEVHRLSREVNALRGALWQAKFPDTSDTSREEHRRRRFVIDTAVAEAREQVDRAELADKQITN